MTSSRANAEGPIVVGVYPGQSTLVINEGLVAAHESGHAIVFAHVRVTSYLTEWDTARQRRETARRATTGEDAVLIAELTEVISGLADRGVSWTLRLIDGDPPKALVRLADEVHASRIIVGSRGAGLVNATGEWLSRSVATRLIHLQHRPVTVVPVW